MSFRELVETKGILARRARDILGKDTVDLLQDLDMSVRYGAYIRRVRELVALSVPLVWAAGQFSGNHNFRVAFLKEAGNRIRRLKLLAKSISRDPAASKEAGTLGAYRQYSMSYELRQFLELAKELSKVANNLQAELEYGTSIDIRTRGNKSWHRVTGDWN